MSNAIGKQSKNNQTKNNSVFKITPIAAFIASITLGASSFSHGAEKKSVDELKAENSRLKELLDQNQQELEQAEKSSTPSNAEKISAKQPEKTTALKGVVVRGRNTNRLAAVQDVPVSIVAISGEELERLGGNTMRDVIKRASNISRQDRSNARSSDLSLRGLGRRANSEALDPSTLVSVDGVSYAYTGLSAWDFVDVNSVEVLRGPTGYAGGKNASVGAVNITTKRPSFTPSTDISLRVGDHDTVVATAAVGGPVIEDLLAWRGTFYVDKQEGEYGNAYDGGDNTYTDRNKISAKVQFLLTPNENFSALISGDIQPNTFENDNGLNWFHPTVANYSNGTATNLNNDAATRLARRWFGQLQSYNYNNNYLNYQSGTQNQNDQRALLTGIRGGSAQLDWNLGTHTLTSLTAYRQLYFDARNDEGTPFDISAQGGGGLNYRQFSQELKLASELGGKVDYVTGLYYIRNRNAVDSKTGWGSDAGAWFATNTLNAATGTYSGQYSRLDATGAGRYLMQNSLNGLRKFGQAVNSNESPAIFGQLNWHLTDPLTLSVGARVTHEKRNASNFAIISNNGYAPELNEGVFNNDTLGALTANNNAAQLAAADEVARKYFGAAVTYATLTAAQQRQIADAKAIRKSQLGLLYPSLDAKEFNKTQYNYFLSPSYKFNEQVIGYVTYQHGEKAGIAQVINGNSANAKPEKTDNIELGFKSSLLERTLTLNADIFLSKITNYQQTAQVVDSYSTAINQSNGDFNTIAYTALTGNAPKVEVKGLEFDAFYSGIKYTTLRVSGAYNDARYKDFPNSQQPPENAYVGAPAFQDVSGRTLPGAAKWTGNIGADFRVPVFTNKEFHVDVNDYITSRYNNDTTLSDYGWVSGYSIVDVGVGFGRRDQTWDATFLVKNLSNKQEVSYGFSNGVLDTTPRWIGVQLTSKL